MPIQKLIHGKFDEIRAKNAAYSLRALARRIDVSPSTLTRILNGERAVSRPLAERICTKLCLDPQQRADVMSAFPSSRRYRKSGAVQARPDETDSSFLQLSTDQFHIIGVWYHFAILSLLRTKDFQNDPAWIAERLGISVAESKEAMERLLRLKVIEQKPDGSYVRTSRRVRTTDDILNVSLQKAHHQNLELAQEALIEVPVELRDFSAITMPASPHLLPKAKELIRKFQDDLSELLESESGTEVYKFCTQLFPLTKVAQKETAK